MQQQLKGIHAKQMARLMLPTDTMKNCQILYVIQKKKWITVANLTNRCKIILKPGGKEFKASNNGT